MKLTIVDLDDTLLDYGFEEENAAQSLCREIALRHKLSEETVLSEYVLAKNESRKIGAGEYDLEARFSILGKSLKLPLNDAARHAQAYMVKRLEACRLLPGAHGLLAELRRKTDHLCVLTNGIQELAESRTEIAGISGYLDGIFSSQRIGVRKPSLAAFAHVMERFHAGFQNTRFLGDSFERDLQSPSFSGGECWLINWSQASYSLVRI